jgi:hypothetical protein
VHKRLSLYSRDDVDPHSAVVSSLQVVDDRRADREAAVRTRGEYQSRLGGLKNAKESHVKHVADRDRKVG